MGTKMKQEDTLLSVIKHKKVKTTLFHLYIESSNLNREK